MGVERRFDQFRDWLKGWPSGALTLALLIGAACIVFIALRGTPGEKAIAAAYVYFP